MQEILLNFIKEFHSQGKEDPLFEFVNELRDILLDIFPTPREVSSLEKIINAPIKIAIAGQFSAGKSTFLNALLGQDVLSSGILPTTSKVCEIRYSKTPYLEVHYTDGTLSCKEIDFLYHCSHEKSANIESFRLFVNVDILKDIVLLDTPGFNSQNETDTFITQNVLNEVDGIIWLSLIDNVGKNSEKVILKNFMKKFNQKSLCVLNQKDRVNESEVETALLYAKQVFEGFSDIVAISSLQAKTSSTYAQSNMELVKRFIKEQILENLAETKRARFMKSLRTFTLNEERNIHTSFLHIRELSRVIDSYISDVSSPKKLEKIQEDAKLNFWLFDAYCERVSEEIYSYLRPCKYTFKRDGFFKKEIKKEVMMFPLEEFLSTINRADYVLSIEINKICGALKRFDKNIALEAFGARLSAWEERISMQKHLDLSKDALKILTNTEFIKNKFQSVVDDELKKCLSKNAELAFLLSIQSKNALSLVAYEIDYKIKKSLKNHEESEDFPIYEPNHATIKEIVDNVFCVELLSSRLFLQNNIFYAFMLGLKNALQVAKQELCLEEILCNLSKQKVALREFSKKIRHKHEV